jgi:RNA polymerase sigma factor (sigma-70 family)
VSIMTMGSRTLFERVCESPRDQTRWGELVDYYTPWLMGWAVHATGRTDVAEDIVQEVFLRLWKNLPHLRTHTPAGKSLRNWISTVTHNLITEWRRHPGTRRCLQAVPGLVDQLQDRITDLDAHLERAEMCERYVLAWEDLVAESKMSATTILSFLLRVRGNLPPEEVAARLDLGSPQAVNTNVGRVRKYLAAKIALLEQHARLIDHLDGIARTSEPCARLLDKCARHYGYAPDLAAPAGLS